MRANMERDTKMTLSEIKAFVGVLGSGKSFQCEKLIKEKGFIKLSFADCLRDMVWKMLGWKPNTPEEYDLFKKGLYAIPVYGKINGRLLLQLMGETMRQIDPDFWTKQMKNNIETAISSGYSKICIDDARYTNELRLLYSYSWKAIVDVTFCDFHSDRYDRKNKHQSELLAQKMLMLGFEDGDKISKKTIDMLSEN